MLHCTKQLCALAKTSDALTLRLCCLLCALEFSCYLSGEVRLQSHGTFLDGKQLPVHKPTKLLNGQTLRFSESDQFAFTVCSNSESKATMPESTSLWLILTAAAGSLGHCQWSHAVCIVRFMPAISSHAQEQ